MTKVLNGLTFGIDAGHGGADSGAVSNGIKEKDITLSISLKLAKRIRSMGGIVIETRNEDKTVSLDYRKDKLNKSNTNLNISIHGNSFKDTKVNGVETFYYQSNKNSKGLTLAQAIQRNLVNDKIFRTDRKVKKGNHLYMIRRTVAPTVLVELGFISNDKDRNVMLKEQDKIVESIIKGICEYFGRKYVGPNSNPKPDNSKGDIFYRVVAGSYREKVNAEKQIKKLEKLGIKGVFLTIYEK